MKNLEIQIEQLAKLMAAKSRGFFYGNTSNNQKNDACNLIGVSNERVTTPMIVDKSEKKRIECAAKKEGDKIEKLRCKLHFEKV